MCVCARAPPQDIYEANDAPSTYNHLIDAVIRTSFTREMYLARLRTLTNNFLRTGEIETPCVRPPSARTQQPPLAVALAVAASALSTPVAMSTSPLARAHHRNRLKRRTLSQYKKTSFCFFRAAVWR